MYLLNSRVDQWRKGNNPDFAYTKNLLKFTQQIGLVKTLTTRKGALEVVEDESMD
jgi:hypothetical protein